MKNILIFTNGEKIGDGIIKLPFIYAIKKRFPNVTIDWMTNEGSTVYNGRLKNISSKLIDTIYERAMLQPLFWKKISYKYDLEKLSYDCIIDTQKAVIRTIALKRIKTDIFISATAKGIFSDKKIYKKNYKRNYYLDDLFDLLDLIKPGRYQDFEFVIPDKLTQKMKDIFHKESLYIGYAPGAGEKDKIWKTDNFVKVAKYFESKNYNSVFFLGPDDLNIKKNIKLAFPNAIYPEEIIKDFSGPEIVMACTNYLVLALSNDSGVSHMLSTKKCLLIKLFGPKEARKFTPNVENIKTISSDEFNSSNINSIPVNTVIKLFEDLLNV